MKKQRMNKREVIKSVESTIREINLCEQAIKNIERRKFRLSRNLMGLLSRHGLKSYTTGDPNNPLTATNPTYTTRRERQALARLEKLEDFYEE